MNPTNREKMVISANSTAYCLLSYLFLFLIFQVATTTASGVFKIPLTLYYNHVGFNCKSDIWTPDSVKVVFSSGNAILLVFAIAFLSIYVKALEFKGMIRMFFLWGFIHATSMVIGSAVVGAFIFEGFGYVLSYIYISESVKMTILIFGIFALIVIGLSMVKSFMFSSNIYYNYISASRIPSFRLYQFVIPYIFSTLFILAYRFPMTNYEMIILAMPVLMFSPLFWRIKRFPKFYFVRTKKYFVFNKRVIYITLIALIIYRIVLGIGINFN